MEAHDQEDKKLKIGKDFLCRKGVGTPMKILIVRTYPDIIDIDSYNVQEIGLAKALTERGNLCDIVLYHGNQEDKIQVYEFEKKGKNLSFKIYWLRGFSLFKNGFMPSVKKIIPDYDVVQVHEYDQIMSWQLYTRPVAPTVLYHGPYYHPYARGYNLKCRVFDRLFLGRRKYRQTVAITKSRLAADFLREKGFEKVIPAGVGINTDNFQCAEKSLDIKKRENRHFRILYVGKIEERRNVYFLVEVFRRLRRKHPELLLTIVGDGEKEYREKFLESIREELEEGSIVCRKKVLQSELPEIYRAADLFLFTSNYEIFGMVLLEAMYFGLPVLSTVNGGASMLIQDGINGFVLKEFDVVQWEAKMNMLIQDRKMYEGMRTKARQTITQGYTWECLAGKFEAAYQRAIEEFVR